MNMSTDAISDFQAFLAAAGMKCVHREAPVNAMGYRLMEYLGVDLRVRLVWEKGFWDVRVADNAMATDVWYDVRLFTYLFGGKPEPRMPLEDQLEYVKNNWTSIIDAFRPNRRIKTQVRLDAAKMERARTVFMIWPTAVLDLETFLSQNGLRCEERKEARFLYDSMSVRYADSRIGIRIASNNGWHIEFADLARDPDRWHSFTSIRRLVQWPADTKLAYTEMFEFIKANWSKIVDLFVPEKNAETYERLAKVEQDEENGTGPILAT